MQGRQVVGLIGRVDPHHVAADLRVLGVRGVTGGHQHQRDRRQPVCRMPRRVRQLKTERHRLVGGQDLLERGLARVGRVEAALGDPTFQLETLDQPGDLLGVPDAQSAAGWFVGVLVSRQHLGQDLGRSVGIDRAAVVQDHHVYPFPTVGVPGLRSVTGLVVVALLHPASLGRRPLLTSASPDLEPVQALAWLA